MRTILACFAALALALPAFAQAPWGIYENARYAYAVDIPPGFEGQGESDNGDGQIFLFDGRVAKLSVWGGFIVAEPDFEAEAGSRLAEDTTAGWGLASQSTTPTWSTWSATKSGRVLHQHMIQLCDGASYAALRLEYAQVDRPRLDPLVDPLIASLTPIC